jgi:general secretion pathway protein E
MIAAPPAAAASPAAGPGLDYAFARQHGAILLSDASPWRVGLRTGADPAIVLELRRLLGAPFEIVELERAAFDAALSQRYSVSTDAAATIARGIASDLSLDSLAEDVGPTTDLLDSQDDAPVIRLINGLISEAITQGASDIHFEPYENHLAVRMRVDGVLRDVLQAPVRAKARVIARIKVMARLDIAERRLPQDGRISLSLGRRAVDVRVATLPSHHGERVVMRLLDKDQNLRGLDALGMSEGVLAHFREALAAPNGIVLVTGPTGSGKTTTLYAALNLLNDRTRNILTVEDPVEYAIEGIGQTQVNPRIGLTFAAGLRAILRQDPNVVMVGEIRDPETAQIAVQASLTGHLVFSTVHTNGAVAAITRLRDMGIEPYLLASTVRFILAQRLVRRLCPSCRRTVRPGVREIAMLAAAGLGPEVFEAAGCDACRGAGYVGRIGVYEHVVIDDTMRRMIHEGASEQEMVATVHSGEAPTLLRTGLHLAAAGVTSLSEVIRSFGAGAER